MEPVDLERLDDPVEQPQRQFLSAVLRIHKQVVQLDPAIGVLGIGQRAAGESGQPVSVERPDHLEVILRLVVEPVLHPPDFFILPENAGGNDAGIVLFPACDAKPCGQDQVFGGHCANFHGNPPSMCCSHCIPSGGQVSTRRRG